MNLVRLKIDSTLKRERVSSYPVFLILEPCNFCNLRCPLCPTGQKLPVARGKMSMEVFTRIIDQLYPYVWHLNLFYFGEPLLCEHLPAMISYAKKHKIRVYVSSNLNIFDKQMAKSLIESRLDQLIVSLDAASQESYEKYRIGGNYQAVIDNIVLLTEMKKQKGSLLPRIQIQFVVFKHNEAEISRIEEIAKELGVEIHIRQGALGGLGQSPPLTKDRKLASKWLSSKKEFRKEYDYFDNSPCIKNGPCIYLWKVATINWDGSVFPCCWIYENEHKFGNIMEEDFKTIWNNEYFMHSRSLFKAGRKSLSRLHNDHKQTICCKCKMFKHNLND